MNHHDTAEVERVAGLHPSLAAAITRVAPYFNADTLPGNWRGTDLLIMGWCMIKSGRHPEDADQFVNDMIVEGRNRYAAGFYANPFEEPARPRAHASRVGDRRGE